MPANPLFSRAHSTFYQHVLAYKSQFQHYLWASVDLYAQKKHRQTTFCVIFQCFMNIFIF